MKILLSILFAFSLVACHSNAESTTNTSLEPKKEVNLEGKSSAYFASGCFWIVEAIYECIKDVEEVYNG